MVQPDPLPAVPDKLAEERLAEQVAARVRQFGKAAKTAGLALATAESCTGGMVCAELVADPQASSVLERGFVVYSVDAKCDLLDLDRPLVEACNGVSEEIARAMAHSALVRSEADLAIAVTGFAGPREGDEEVGLVHIAAANVDRVIHRTLHLGDIGRRQASLRATGAALELALDLLVHTPRRAG